MDVTDQVLQHHLLYGGSDNTSPDNTSASFSINYANGTSIHSPIEVSFTSVPYTMKFKESVGLHGIENCFYKINLNIDSVNGCLEDDGYECIRTTWVDEVDPGWDGAVADFYKDTTIQAYYEPARLSQVLPDVPCPKVTVNLKNKGTGNKYNDSWLDVRLYDSNRQPISENDVWINAKGYFYVGFHARNTRRLPYDVECVIGKSYMGAADIKDSGIKVGATSAC